MKRFLTICLVYSLLQACSSNQKPPIDPPPAPPVDTNYLATGWQMVQVTSAPLYDISLIDQNNMVTVSPFPIEIQGSINGGSNWSQLPIYSIINNIITTSDNSLHWTTAQPNDRYIGRYKNGVKDSVLLANHSSDIFFLDSLNGYTSLTDGSGLARTINGGTSWQVVNTGLAVAASSHYSNLAFLDSNNAILAWQNSIYFTHAGINSWTASQITNAPTSTYFNTTLAMPSADRQYAGFSNGNVYRSADGGQTFQPLPIPTQDANKNMWLDLEFLDPDNGYACYNDLILHTANGGAKWDTAVYVKGKQFIELDFSDPNHGAACTGQGAVYLYKK